MCHLPFRLVSPAAPRTVEVSCAASAVVFSFPSGPLMLASSIILIRPNVNRSVSCFLRLWHPKRLKLVQNSSRTARVRLFGRFQPDFSMHAPSETRTHISKRARDLRTRAHRYGTRARYMEHVPVFIQPYHMAHGCIWCMEWCSRIYVVWYACMV